jgi:two-component system NtrC family sensor kinase
MGTTSDAAIGKSDFDFWPRDLATKFFTDEQALIQSGTAILELEEPGLDKLTGEVRTVVTSKVPLRDDYGAVIGIIGLGFDITERKRAEQRLASGERLESIGRLAAGVAHEINTPIQYLNDSVYFIREAMQELMAHNQRLQSMLPSQPEPDEEIEDLKRELPPALDRVVDGLGRIAEIVRSMKEFSHVDHREMSQVDLNRAVNSTLVIARSEYKYVADLETEFGELPLITCHGGQINQVILNLVVNAAHAVGDSVRGSAHKGVIKVRTYSEGDYAVISIADTGGGIPEAIQKRIFEPFFTTKEVGRGTGQGLSIASNVMKAHGGSLDFKTILGKGSTFFIRLPLAAKEGATAAA